MMKKLELNLNVKKWLPQAAFMMMTVTMLSLSSCLKSNNDQLNTNTSALAVIHASPGLVPFDFYLDGQRLNTYQAFNYSNKLNYVNIYSGARKFGIYKSQTSDSIKTGVLNAEIDKYYSIYVTGEAANPEFLILDDELKTPATGKAQVRFLNLSVNAPGMTLSAGADSTLFSDVAYKSHSSFKDIPAGKNYTFTTYPSNDPEAKTTISDFPIASNHIYTIWSGGIYDSTTDSLKVGLQIQADL